MDRETLIATATATYTATAGTSTEKLRAAIRDLVGVLQANDVMLVTDRGTQFVATLTAPLDTIPGRPAYPDALAFAASMETMILAAKGTANLRPGFSGR